MTAVGLSPRVASLARDLLESDRSYFESAARLEPLPAASLAWMPGLEQIPAGCVVQRIESPTLPADLDRWLARVEAGVREVGASRPRLYLDHPAPALEAALRRRWYRPREEIGFVRAEPPAHASGAVRLRPVITEADWAAKLRVHEAAARAGAGPDGHLTPATAWVEMERKKSEAGYLEPFLVDVNGEVGGTICAADQGELLRLKNIVIHPAWRRNGLGDETVRLVAGLAAARGKLAIGCFGIAGEPGEALYRRCGFRAVTSQTEWM